MHFLACRAIFLQCPLDNAILSEAIHLLLADCISVKAETLLDSYIVNFQHFMGKEVVGSMFTMWAITWCFMSNFGYQFLHGVAWV